MLANYLKGYQFLSDKVADVTKEQWKFLAAQSQFGLSLWHVMLGDSQPVASSTAPPGGVAEPARERPPASLDQVVAERVKEGLAPPREIYDIRNRGRINWSNVPDWAKPVDPEVFEGAHEG